VGGVSQSQPLMTARIAKPTIMAGIRTKIFLKRFKGIKSLPETTLTKTKKLFSRQKAKGPGIKWQELK
jgi:hypothetical protein